MEEQKIQQRDELIKTQRDYISDHQDDVKNSEQVKTYLVVIILMLIISIMFYIFPLTCGKIRNHTVAQILKLIDAKLDRNKDGTACNNTK